MKIHTSYLRWSILLAIIFVSVLAMASFFNVLSPAYAAVSTTHIVSEGESIQAAIDGAAVGDTVLVQAGSYTESLRLDKAVNLTGVNSRTTILNGPTGQRVISVSSGIDTSTIISGFTIQNGAADSFDVNDAGGGLYLIGTPLLSHLVIISNSAVISGGGIYAAGDLHLQHSFAQDNEGAWFSSFAYIEQDLYLTNTQIMTHTRDSSSSVINAFGQAFVRDSQFLHGSGTAVSADGFMYVENSLMSYSGAGIYSLLGDIHVVSSTVTHNLAGVYSEYGSVYITNTTVSHNTFYGGVSAGQNFTAYSSTIVNNISVGQNGSTAGTPTIGNGYGGGVFMGRSGHIENSIISSNTATYLGGGVYVSRSVEIVDTKIENNQANWGGGLATQQGSIDLTDCDIRFNHANAPNSGMGQLPAFGGGIYADVVSMENCLVESNTTGGWVPSMMVNRYFTLTNSVVRNHQATGADAFGLIVMGEGLISGTQIIDNQGGLAAVNVWFSNYSDAGDEVVVVQNSVISNNQMASGGIYVTTISPAGPNNRVIISNTQIITNTAATAATGVTIINAFESPPISLMAHNLLIENRSDHHTQPAIYINDGYADLHHLTIVSEPSVPQPAIYISSTSPITLQNSIVASYTAGVDLDAASVSLWADFNLFSSADPFSGTMITDGGHNLIDTNPLFVGFGDYRLAAGSPAIDAAAPSDVSVDILGNPRPGFGSSLPDIGAYECDTSPELTDFSAMLAGGSVQWSWSGGDDYRLWGTGVPYQAVSGEGQLLTDATFTDSVSDMTAYFYTLSPLSNCGVTAEVPMQLGVFPFGLTAGTE